MTRRYVIIGSGAAGLAAAQAVRRTDAGGQILMISEDPYGYYSRPGLAYLLAGEIPQEMLYPYPRDFPARIGLDFSTAQVSRIDPGEHRLTLAGGQQIPYDRLLLATGAQAAPLDLPGANLPGVVKLDNMEDALRILKLARRGETAVVVGGGITALELAEGLHARGMHVHYLLRGERYWPAVLDEVESGIVERRLKECGIHIHYHTRLLALEERGGRLAGVRVGTGEREQSIACRMLAVAIGIRPRTALAAEAGLKVERGVLVDDGLQTSHPDIYAAGDAAQVFDPATGEHTVDSLWGSAIEQGAAAGANLAGAGRSYRKRVPFNVTRLAGLVTTIIGQVGREPAGKGAPGGDADVSGIMRGDSETWRSLPDAQVAQTAAGDQRVRLLVSGTRLVGALVAGDQTISRPLQHMIRAGRDIGPLRERLLEPGAPLGELIMNHWAAHLSGADSDTARKA